MGKKSKEEKKDSSDIFKTLFGGSSQEGGLLLFSNNPFRRNPKTDHLHQQKQKPLDDQLGFDSNEGERNPENGNPSEKEVKKRKREKHREGPKSDGVDDDSTKRNPENGLGFDSNEGERNPENGTPSEKEVKKRKREKQREEPKSDGFDDDSTKRKKMSAVDDANKQLDGGDGSQKRKKNKKRKRDEIEEEYEARNCSVIEKTQGVDETKLSKKVVGEKRKKVDDSAEMVVSREAYDDESKLQRTVFVGNLPLKVKKKVLLKEFVQFGEVESIRIRSVPIMDSKMPRKGAVIKGKFNDSVDSVHAYIVFKDEQSAQASLSHNMAKVGGNHIRVDTACPPRKKLKGENAPIYDNKRTVFVGNLPFDVKDEELYQLFCGINQLESSVEAVRVIRDPHSSMGKGIAYVLLKTRDAANSIVKKKYVKLRERNLRLSHARSDSTPSKRENPTSKLANESPAKRFAVASGEVPSMNDKPKPKAASLSYQGLRASKSGVQKKVNLKPRTSENGKFKPKRRGDLLEKKAEKTKRPAVSARKASGKRPAVAARKATALKGSGGLPRQHTGKKRRLESGSPENSHKSKKARNFR